MSKLAKLFKIQFAEAMFGQSVRKRNGVFKKAGPAGAIIIWLILTAIAAFYNFIMGEVLIASGAPLKLLPCVNLVAASILTLLTTIYKVNGLLFGFKDYDLVMSLPVPTAGIVGLRMLILYLYNMYYMLMVLLPAGIAYAYYAHPPAAYWPVFIILVLLSPMAPVAIASYIGSLITYAASFFKKKSAISLAFMLVLLFGWLFFSQNSGTAMQNLAENGRQALDAVSRYYPPAYWFAGALCDFNMTAFFLYAALSIGLWALFCVIFGKYFKAANAWVMSTHTRSDFKMGELKTMTPQKALFNRELKRFTSSAPYMLNAAVGAVMAPAFTVVTLFMPAEAMSDINSVPGAIEKVWYMAPLIICFFLGTVITTACSISLENGSLWIVKTLPVKTMDILNAKLKLNLVLTLPVAVICSTIFAVGFKPSVPAMGAIYLLPIADSLFIAVFGQYMNLKYPVFDWDSEVMVIKRGKAVGITAMLPLTATIAVAVLTFVVGAYVVFIYAAVLLILANYFYRHIKTKGVAMFEGYE